MFNIDLLNHITVIFRRYIVGMATSKLVYGEQSYSSTYSYEGINPLLQKIITAVPFWGRGYTFILFNMYYNNIDTNTLITYII